MIYQQYILLVKSQVLCREEPKLLKYKKGYRNQCNGDRKLKCDKTVSQPAGFHARRDLSFQHLNRLKCGEIKCRVNPGNETQGQRQHNNDQRSLPPGKRQWQAKPRSLKN